MTWWRRKPPAPPVNVRVIDAHDVAHAVQCVYVGRDGPVHLWEAVLPDHVGRVVGVRADVIPPKTAIRLPYVR